MVWLGYTGFSGAIVLSIAMLTSMLGLSAEATLSVAAAAAAAMLGVGVAVHLLVLLVGIARAPRRRPLPPPRLEPAFLRPPTAKAAATPALLKPIAKPTTNAPGAIGVLFPGQVAQ